MLLAVLCYRNEPDSINESDRPTDHLDYTAFQESLFNSASNNNN